MGITQPSLVLEMYKGRSLTHARTTGACMSCLGSYDHDDKLKRADRPHPGVRPVTGGREPDVADLFVAGAECSTQSLFYADFRLGSPK